MIRKRRQSHGDLGLLFARPNRCETASVNELRGSRRRDKPLAAATTVILVTAATAAILVASFGGSARASATSAAAEPTVSVGYPQGEFPLPETVIGGTHALLKSIPAHIKWVPITSGTIALSEMSAGAFGLLANIGGPPAVASIAHNFPVDIVWLDATDGDSLLVPSSITTPAQLAGKSVGYLEGSSEEWEIREWVAHEHIPNVNFVGFTSEALAASAWLAGSVDASYVEGALALNLEHHGAHPLTNAIKIGELGYVNAATVMVSRKLVRTDPSLVQKYVCAENRATNDLLGRHSAKYVTTGLKLMGLPGSQARSAFSVFRPYYISSTKEKYWLIGSRGGAAGSREVAALQKMAVFEKSLGNISSIPSAKAIASHIDTTFAANAIAGRCS